MVSINKEDVIVPLDVPKAMRETYVKNYMKITKGSGRLMLFAGDQKVEQLNADFFGEEAPEDDADPEYLFRTASQKRIRDLGNRRRFITRYGMGYRNVHYLGKINSKTNPAEISQTDPFSNLWYDVDQVAEFKEDSGLDFLGVGYTIYLDSEFEAEMLVQAAQVVKDAHQHGMVSVLWIHSRRAALKYEKDRHLITSLGADFVNVTSSKNKGAKSAKNPDEITKLSGCTKYPYNPSNVKAQVHVYYYVINDFGKTPGDSTRRDIQNPHIEVDPKSSDSPDKKLTITATKVIIASHLAKILDVIFRDR